MNVCVILAHPNRNSFNHAIAFKVLRTLEKYNHTIVFHDLYKEKFDPVMPMEEIMKDGEIEETVHLHCRELTDADGIVFIHPNWWGQPPAILTGWLDRVLRPGIAYRFDEDDSGEGIPDGLLKGKTAVVFNTSDTPDDREINFFGDPLDRIWKRCICEFCGITNYTRRVFNIIVTSTLEERREWLAETEEIVSQFFNQ